MNDILTLAARQSISQELLDDSVASKTIKQELARHLQITLGEGVISTLWDMGGCGTVQLKFGETDDSRFMQKNFDLRAAIGPARDVNYRIIVPHFEYFPADWWCVYCGSLLDGLKTPRKCPQCGAPRAKEMTG